MARRSRQRPAAHLCGAAGSGSDHGHGAKRQEAVEKRTSLRFIPNPFLEVIMRSYVITRLGPLGRINEVWNLYLGHTRHLPDNVDGLLGQARASEAKISSLLGRPAAGLKM